MVGFLVLLFGEVIQLWSFAALVKNEQLTARGPYVLVCNPMYLGRFFLILGLVLLLGNAYITIAYVVLYYFYMVNRVPREELRLTKILGQPYRDYCLRVNRYVPAFVKLLDPTVRFFDWGVLLRTTATGIFWRCCLSMGRCTGTSCISVDGDNHEHPLYG